MKLPESFKQTIIATYGETGITWLASLDSLLPAIKERFALTTIELMAPLSYNLVATAESKTYGSCVLKVSPDEHLKREALALTYYNGLGGCRKTKLFTPKKNCLTF